MPARVVVVLDDPPLAYRTAAALASDGVDAVAFADPMAALVALESSRRVEALVTSVEFALGKPNGVALARMAKAKRSGIEVVFLGGEEMEQYTSGLGELVSKPAGVAELVATVTRHLPVREPLPEG